MENIQNLLARLTSADEHRGRSRTRDPSQNPYRVRDARQEYKALKMKYGQTFHDFKTKYLHLANEAQIPNSERLDDIYDKLTLAL